VTTHIFGSLSTNPSVPQQSDILTPEEVAALLRVSTGWVHEKCRARSRNPLPARRIGRYLRFRRSEVLAWFDGTAAPAKKGRR
jgi:excisionase family DNA binding protein